MGNFVLRIHQQTALPNSRTTATLSITLAPGFLFSLFPRKSQTCITLCQVSHPSPPLSPNKFLHIEFCFCVICLSRTQITQVVTGVIQEKKR